MSSNTSDKKLIEEEDSHAFIHVRVDTDLKNDLIEHAKKENTSLTSLVTTLIEDFLYKKDESEEEDEEDQLMDLIVNSLVNLERRMEIRLATLQDTFNSLIGRLIDTQQSMGSTKPSQLRKRRKGGASDGDEEDGKIDLSDILEVDKEEEVYRRVKRLLQQQGKVVDLNTVIQQIEVDRTLKDYLDNQAKQAPGWKEALITDAIQEAAYELGFPMIDTI
ncbi:MAG: hypothetical protein OEZ01_02245 [Candidatus Heimdallarchaeota archaeon]|nr:hypothetical protein [Candidatus Heimdallarchaeota archaeon]MDH5644796.1 hypothetical protein [Candidatus Heimdallarchaeota archaeon]